jgi:predicted nucleic acid-binding protein
MSGVKFLLDTNILIGLLSRNEAVSNLLIIKRVKIAQCALFTIMNGELLIMNWFIEERCKNENS